MDIRKHYEFFNPHEVPEVHIIGCGAIGSALAFHLAHLGVEKFHLWDEDTVEQKNIANQYFRLKNIGEQKTKATKLNILSINPLAKVEEHNFYDKPTLLKGIVFLSVDDVAVRRQIIKDNRYNYKVEAYFDTRMRLIDGQSYAATFKNQQSIETLLESLDFTHEEAEAATPVSACGTKLNVINTVTMLAGYTISNFMHFMNEGTPDFKLLMVNTYKPLIERIKF